MKKYKPFYIVDGKLSATQYHPDEVAFMSWKENGVFSKKRVCDSNDLKIEELKAKYATGNYIVYFKTKPMYNYIKFPRTKQPSFGDDLDTVLIALKDEKIADVVIANLDVEVIGTKGNGFRYPVDSFFKEYNENHKYQLKEQPKQVSEDAFTVTETAVFPKKEKVSGDFASKVYELTYSIAEMLISKNKKYGNSALEPNRIFSKMDSIEQLYVRIDDKLSRISNQNLNDDEDVIEDLIGYLVLLKIAKS